MFFLCCLAVDEDEHHPGTYWLGSIARGTMHAYTECILRIHELTPYSTQQLLADIGELTSCSTKLEEKLPVIHSTAFCYTLRYTGLKSSSKTAGNISKLVKSYFPIKVI